MKSHEPTKTAHRAQPPVDPTPEGHPSRRWTFLSNHAHVLVCLRLDSRARIRDLAERIGITERAVQKILADLEQEGLVTRDKEGRRNHYRLDLDQPLRHSIEAHRSVRELVDLMLPEASRGASRANGRSRS